MNYRNRGTLCAIHSTTSSFHFSTEPPPAFPGFANHRPPTPSYHFAHRAMAIHPSVRPSIHRSINPSAPSCNSFHQAPLPQLQVLEHNSLQRDVTLHRLVLGP